MTFVVVETVGDEAAAAVLIEALAAHGIAAQRRRVPGTPYGANKLEIEVRVPAAQLAAARGVLEQLAEEAEAAALREARLVDPIEPPSAEPQQRRQAKRPWARHERVLLVAAVVLALSTLYGVIHGTP
jgi:hypothetical protein